MFLNKDIKLSESGNPTVDLVGNLKLYGCTVHNSWFKYIKRDTGKTNFTAINVLAGIVNMYTPCDVRDERGVVTGIAAKFHTDIPQISYEEIAEMYEITKREAKIAVAELESLGIIQRVFRTQSIYTEKGIVKKNNVLYIALNVKRLYEISDQPFPVQA